MDLPVSSFVSYLPSLTVKGLVCCLFQNYAYFNGLIFYENQLILLVCHLFENYASFDGSIAKIDSAFFIMCNSDFVVKKTHKDQLGFYN